MYRKPILFVFVLFSLIACQQPETDKQSETIEITKDEIFDKIKGGLVGQLLGNLNGLPHEFKYVNEPGNVTDYTPALPEGARTDDDTDLEWMYIYYMQQEDTLFLPYDVMPRYWKQHVNFKVWAANLMARQLMEIGFVPPATGNRFINPWSRLNLAGQFTCEIFALAAPGMPEVAEKLGLHYTRVVIDGEPAQGAQLFTAMIAEAFITEDIQQVLEAGIKALDEKSETYKAVQDVIKWYNQYPDDWKETREKIKNKYHDANGNLPINNDGVNTSAIIAAYLYGQGDFLETMKLAFNIGWDADCNAATVETILGVMYGYEWMEQQGWDIKDRYWNTTRPGLPEDETITSFAERIAILAEKAILQNDGSKNEIDGQTIYNIKYQSPVSLHSPVDDKLKYERTVEEYSDFIEETYTSSNPADVDLMKATYLVLCFDQWEQYQQSYPEKWEEAKELLQGKPMFMHTLHDLPDVIAKDLKKRASEAGIVMKEIEPAMQGNTTFTLPGYQNAKAVYLGGTFNNWQTWRDPMAKTGNGWICKIDLDKGKYTYKFMIVKEDGTKTWVLDPDNPEQEINKEGYTNSLLIVE